MSKQRHFRVCKDRTGDELNRYGLTFNMLKLDRALAEQYVVASDIKFAFRKSSKYSVSRYSDGSWPVLYTAKEETTAICEVAYHARKEWRSVGRSSQNYKQARKLLYALEIDCSDQLVVAADPLLTAPDATMYPHCHDVARKAIGTGKTSICVPSARHQAGNCVPVFVDHVVEPRFGLGARFTLRWDVTQDKLSHTADSKRLPINLWQP